MSLLDRFSNLWHRPKLHAELDEELQFHLDARTRDNRSAGMSEHDARLDARRRFGSPALTKERAYEMDIIASLDTLARDARYAFRSLRKSPGFAAVSILTMALGIGANTAVFTVVNGVLLRPLPFPQADRLFLVSYRPINGPFQSGPGLADAYYLEFERRNQSFERVATFGQSLATITGNGEAARMPEAQVTPGFFSALGVNPSLGRPFQPGEERDGSHLAILSDHLWRTRFAADPDILAKTITLDGVPHKVVAVMPAHFALPEEAELWVPLAVGSDGHNSFFRPVVGRLRPGVSPQQAAAEWDALIQHLPIGRGDSRANMIAEVLPLKDLLTTGIRKSLLIFMGAVGFVLLIACANVANLLLMRGTARRREIAVRAALGASRPRLIRQLLTESTLIALCGAVAGVALAYLGVPALLMLAPHGRIPRTGDIRLDASVLAFALGAGALTGILFGLIPALRTTGQRLGDFAVSMRRERLRGILVVSEIALTLVLLAGAGLMLKSFVRMRAVQPGFQAENILTMSVDLPDTVYHSAESLRAFDQRLLEQLAAVPGVLSAGAANWFPLSPALTRGSFHLEDGRPTRRLVDKPAVSPDYFRVMGIRLLSGRAFTAQDTANSTPVAIVSESVARAFWPNGDAVGKRLTLEDEPKPEDWLTVVGVVDNVLQQSLTERPHSAIYQPYEQVRRTFFLDHMTFAVRTASDPRAAAASMRAVLHGIDRDQPAQSIATMSDLVDASTAEPWFQARLIAIFSLLALLLSAIGIYGVLAYAVAERTREIGIRMALGAKRYDITRMIVRRSFVLAISGVAIGLAGALAVTRVLSKLLFAVTPTDPLTFTLSALLLMAVALAAGLPSARRATKVDPLVALRWE